MRTTAGNTCLFIALVLGASSLLFTATGCGGGGGGGGAIAPTITNVVPSAGGGVTPAGGPQSGGTPITITGTRFVADTTASLGPNAATNVVVVNDTTITCTTPPGQGTVDVKVSTPGGTASLPGAFSYHPLPTLTEVQPDTGFTPAGAEITLTGAGFIANAAGLNAVMIGGALATNVAATGDATIGCAAPEGTAGPADVVVANVNGQAILSDGFTFYGYPPNFPADDMRLNTGTVGAMNPRPQISHSGSRVYVTWADRDTTGMFFDVYFQVSADGGATWQATDTRLNTIGLGGMDVEPQICSEGSNVYVTWTDIDNLAMTSSIYFRASTDGGVTWQASDTRLNTSAIGGMVNPRPQVSSAGSNVYVTWTGADLGGMGSDIYFRASPDGGVTWQTTDTRLNTSAFGTMVGPRPQVCGEGSNVYVIWSGAQTGGMSSDVYFSGSADGGTTWRTTETRLNTGGLSTMTGPRPQISANGSNVYVTWAGIDSGGMSSGVYFRASADGGATWPATDARLNTIILSSMFSPRSQISSEGSNVFVTWAGADSGGMSSDVYFKASTDGGATWQATETRLNSGALGTMFGPRAQICSDGPNVFVVWEDEEITYSDIYFNASLDGGATWQLIETRLNPGPPSETAYCTRPQIGCDGARVYATWEDTRSLMTEIHFTASQP